VLRAALAGVAAGAQGRVMAEVLADIAAAEAALAEEASPRPRPGGGRGRVRRRVVSRLMGRRERLRRGWAFTVTGPDATEALAAAVMDWLRRGFAPA
jgi:hypothetical protein